MARSSARKQKSAEMHKVAAEEESNQEHDASDEESVEVGTTSSKSKAKSNSSEKLSSREMRRKRREEIRAKNEGVGLSIKTEIASTKNRKINFDDDVPPSDKDDEPNSPVVPEAVDEGSDEEDSDDDAVEEVQSNVARAKAMNQRAIERETLKQHKEQHRTKKRPRKERKEEAMKEDEAEEFDDDFFAQVDSEMAQHQKEQEELKKDTQPKGRHTTFISEDDQADLSRPIELEQNIELVVLGNSESSATKLLSSGGLGRKPSGSNDAINLFARSGLLSGKNQVKKGIGGKKTKKKQEAGWVRSKKTNTLATGRARFHRKRGRGTAAVQFVVKS